MEQRSPEWIAARLGSVTASRVSDALAGPDTAARRNYLIQLVTERLTGQQQESYTNAAMQWGTETEPLARAMYQATLTGDSFVEEAPFVKHPTIEWFGASPDGFVSDGLVEIKCPNSTTHIDYVIEGKVPTKYKKQILAQLACTNRKWCDFVSFDPRVPDHLQLFVVRFEPKQEEIEKLEEGVKKFLDEVNKAMEALNAR
jgi:putative phage-type endonuclease